MASETAIIATDRQITIHIFFLSDIIMRHGITLLSRHRYARSELAGRAGRDPSISIPGYLIPSIVVCNTGKMRANYRRVRR